MRFRFIAAEKASHSVTILCRCLRVTPQWLLRLVAAAGVAARARGPPAEGAGAARRSTRASSGTAVRAFTRISLEQQERVSRKRVIRLMQEDGLKARARKRFKRTTMSDHDQPVAANLLDRQFTARGAESALGRRHHRVRHRRERQAVSGRDPRSVLAVHRRLGRQRGQRSASDDQGPRDGAASAGARTPACCITPTRAAPTRARTTRPILDAHGIVCSMSRRGNCYDNAVMESFFSTAEERARRSVRQPERGEDGAVRLHRGVLQPATPTLDDRQI